MSFPFETLISRFFSPALNPQKLVNCFGEGARCAMIGKHKVNDKSKKQLFMAFA
jgi:hypothetical protein